MRPLGVIALVAALLAGCGDAGGIVPIAPRVASLAELTGPWRPTPFVLDPDWRARIFDKCRREMEAGPGVAEGIIDARGAGVVTVRLTGAGAAKCDALHITANGHINGAGGGMGGGPELVEAPPDDMLGFPEVGFVHGGELTVRGWSVTGRAGRGIDRVEVVTTAHPPVEATLENGWYSAWWPTAPGDRRVERGVMPDVLVRGFDAGGQLISERRAE